MTLEERIARVEIAVGQHTELFYYLGTVLEGLTSAVSDISHRLDRIETRLTNVENRLTNVETDLAILKSWLGPPSENGNLGRSPYPRSVPGASQT